MTLRMKRSTNANDPENLEHKRRQNSAVPLQIQPSRRLDIELKLKQCYFTNLVWMPALLDASSNASRNERWDNGDKHNTQRSDSKGQRKEWKQKWGQTTTRAQTKTRKTLEHESPSANDQHTRSRLSWPAHTSTENESGMQALGRRTSWMRNSQWRAKTL